LNDSQFDNLSGTSCTINSFDQPLILGNHHSHASICHDECPSTSCDLPFSHEYSNSELEHASVKEDICIETSPSPHFPLCPTIHNASTCGRDTPCSFFSPFDELSPQLTQGGDVVHDKIENCLIIERPSHFPSSLLLHEYNSSNHLPKAKKSGEICDRDGCHPEKSFEISTNNHPQVMHDLVQTSK